METKTRRSLLLLPPLIAALLTWAVYHVSARHLPEPPARPATHWAGQIAGDATLSPADNPHHVTQDLIVPAGVTMTVEPGAELYFAADASLIVYGRLLAQGNPTQTILFTWLSEGEPWGAIALFDTHADNRITHAVIEFTSKEESVLRSNGVSAYNARVTLADSVLRHTRGKDSAGVVANATGNGHSVLHVLRNEIYDIQGDAVQSSDGVAVIQGNHIHDVRLGDYTYEGIQINRTLPGTPTLVLENHVHDTSDDCLDMNDASLVIRRNHVYNCTDKGISIAGAQASSVTIINNLVYASQLGIAIKDSAVAYIAHNTVADNGTDGLALYEDPRHPGYGGGHVTAVNNIFWGNGQAVRVDAFSTLTLTYSDVQGGWPGAGNLDADPLFLAAGDYRLNAASPAIDAGQEQGIAVDFDGHPRPVGRAPDMGAFEHRSLALHLSAWPGDDYVRLAWQLGGDEPALDSFAISYTVRPWRGSTLYPPGLVTGLPTATRAYTLTPVVEQAWYTLVVEGRDPAGGLLVRSNRVSVLLTDHHVYLPLALRGHGGDGGTLRLDLFKED